MMRGSQQRSLFLPTMAFLKSSNTSGVLKSSKALLIETVSLTRMAKLLFSSEPVAKTGFLNEKGNLIEVNPVRDKSPLGNRLFEVLGFISNGVNIV